MNKTYQIIFKSIFQNRVGLILPAFGLFLILGFCFGGCCGVQCNIHYIYNDPVPLNKADFTFGRSFGLSINNSALSDLFEIVGSQVNDFSGHELKFQDVSSSISLVQDHMMIENMDLAKTQFPDMQYILIVNPYAPHISSDEKQINEGEKYDNDPSKLSTPKTAKTDVKLYTSSSSIQCEVILFDLNRKKLVAKAVNSFEGKIVIEEKDTYKNKTLLGTIEDLEKLLPDPEKIKTTEIKKIPRGIFEDFFNQFLRHIGNKDCRHSGKRPYHSSPCLCGCSS